VVPSWLEVQVPQVQVLQVPQVLQVVPTCWEVLDLLVVLLEPLVPLAPTAMPVPGTAPGTVPGTATAGTAMVAWWLTPTAPWSPPPATPPDSAMAVSCPTPTELLSLLSLRTLWLHARSTWLYSK